MLAFFVLFFGNCVLHSEARDSANIWGGSRLLLVTDLPNATVNVDKLYTSLADRGLADVFNRLVIVHRGHDGHFIKSHGSFRALSSAQERTLSISKKEILPWLLKQEPNDIICVADGKADVPQILISAQRKGMFPLDTKLTIWMISGDVVAADGMKMISLISPGEFDSRSRSLDNEDRFASREVRLISARNLESAVIEVFQRGKGDVHHRERRGVQVSSASSMTIKAPIPSSSPAAGQSVSSSMTTMVPILSSSSAVSQSVSSSMTTEVSVPSSSLAFVQSVPTSMTIKAPVPSSSAAVGQSVSSSMTIKVSIPSLSTAVGQTVSSSMTIKVPLPSSSPDVGQSVSSSMTIKAPIPSSSPAVGQSVSSSMTIKVPIPSSSAAAGQSVSSSMTTMVPILSSSSAVSQSVSSSMTTEVSVPSSSLAFVQSVPTSIFTKVSSPAVGETVLSSLTSQLVVPSSSATTASVVSSPVRQSMSGPVSTKGTAVTASLSGSPARSSSVVVRPSEDESRSSLMIVRSFTETKAATSTVPIKPSSSVASLSSSSISLGPPSTPGQKGSAVTTFRPIVSSSLPVIITPSTPRRSTPLRVLSSSVASESTTLSTSTVILATSTKREPLPSSSLAVVTEKPPIYENEIIVIEFEGICEDVVGNKETKMKFQQELERVVVEKLGIPENAVVVNDIACGSIRVTFTINGTSGKANVSQVLKTLVDNGNISVTVDGKTFKASKLEVLRPTTPSTLAPTTENKKSEIAFILYITFGALMAFIFIVGFVVLVVRCRGDRREGSFFLPSDAHYELRRFHGIPHSGSNYSRVDFYGEPVEKDAAAADPDANDEFQPGAGAYPYDVAPTGGDAVASNRSDSKVEKFNVGTMGMPEWKNLHKPSVKEITVAKPSEDIPKSSGSVGGGQRSLGQERPQEDSTHAYDNPLLTFGDGAAGVDKEDS